MKMLMRPELLILDDLGAERNTSFGRERVFDVVNKRLLTGKPMIVTTNIPLSVMQKACRSGRAPHLRQGFGSLRPYPV